MGKKSKSKKIVRELVKEKIEEGKIVDKKSKKELKKEIKESVKVKKPKADQKKEEKRKEKNKLFSKAGTKLKSGLDIVKTVNKKRLFGILFALIMFLILVSVGVLIFKKAFRPTPIAEYLPAETTVMVMEVNVNPQHHQFIKTETLLKNYPQYSFDSLVKFLENTYKFDYQKNIKTWLGRQAGTAYLKQSKDVEEINKIYFAEILSPKNLEIVLNGNEKQNYKKHIIYKLNGSAFVTTLDDYVFFSPKEEAVKQILDTLENNDKRLSESEDYKRISNNLPVIRMAFLYLSIDKIDDGFFKETPFLSEKGISSSVVYPFLKLFKAEGSVFVALDDSFAMESFLTLNLEDVSGGEYITFKQKYNAGLSDYISKDALAFWGGQNLEYQLKRMEEVFSGGDKEVINIFDIFIQDYAQRYFGDDIDFKEDILPLFENEFALTIENLEGENVYKLLVELGDYREDALKIQELAGNFAKMGGFMKPKIVEHTLADGTVSREIVADPREIEYNEEIYKDTTIYGLKMGEKNWGMYYTFINNIAVVSNNTNGVKGVIDIITGDKISLRGSELYDLSIKPVLKNSDEISYFNIEKLLPVIFETKVIVNYLKPIESLSSGKNYFNDGIKTINYLHIK